MGLIQLVEQLPGGHVPKLHGMVIVGRNKQLAIWTEINRPDGASMLQGGLQFACRNVPKLRRSVIAPGGQGTSIRAEGKPILYFHVL